MLRLSRQQVEAGTKMLKINELGQTAKQLMLGHLVPPAG